MRTRQHNAGIKKWRIINERKAAKAARSHAAPQRAEDTVMQSDTTTTKVMSEGATKDGSIVRERVAFLIGKLCSVRVWWNQEAQLSTPGGDLFVATLTDVVPIGRDYYFVFVTPGDNPKRSIIKTAAVLAVSEVVPCPWAAAGE